MKGDLPWVSRDMINYALKVYKKQQQSNAISDATVAAPADDASEPEQKKGGSPVGMTASNKLQKDVLYRLCLDDIAIEYDTEKRNADKLGKRVATGYLKRLITKHKNRYGLGQDVDVKESTIRSRFHTQKFIVKSMGTPSPMANVEPALVGLILKIRAIRRCLTPSQCLHLANDLVAGTETEKQVIQLKKNCTRKTIKRLSLE